MKFISAFSQKLPAILISAVIGLLLAMIIGLSALDILAYGLRRQLLILALLALALGVLCYVFLIRLPAPSKTRLALNDTEFGAVIRRIFLAFFFLFPVSLIFYQQIVELLQILRTGRSSDFVQWYWLPVAPDGRALLITVFLLSFLMILTLLFAGARPSVRNVLNNLPDWYYVLFLFLSSLALRLLIIDGINTQPVSDFRLINEDALALAQGGRPSHMYVATHVAVTMVYGFLYRIFGLDLNVLKIFHAIAYGLAGIFLYAAGKRVFESKLWAAFAGFLLIIWPSLAFYSNVLTPEHLFILLEGALVFAVAYWFSDAEQAQARSRFIIAIIIGFLLGLMGMFRPFSELFLVAFVVTLFMYIRNLKIIAVSLLCVLLAFWLLRDIPTTIASYYRNWFGNIRPCNLLVGLNFEAAGQYTKEDVALCAKLRSEIPDEAALSRAVIGIVQERFQQQQDDLIPFVDQKFAILWANSNGILFWSAQPVIGTDPFPMFEFIRKINLVDFAIMLLFTLTCVIGTLIAFFKDVKPALFFCLLAFFGFNLMEIPFELQTRYRTVVMPLLIFFASWTLAAISARMNSGYHDSSTGQNSQGASEPFNT